MGSMGGGVADGDILQKNKCTAIILDKDKGKMVSVYPTP